MINSFIWRQIPAPMWLIAGALVGFGCSNVPNKKTSKEDDAKNRSGSTSETAKVVQVGFSCTKENRDCTYGMEVMNNHSNLVEISYKAYFYDDQDVIIDSQESGGVVPPNSSAYFGGEFFQQESNQAVRIDVDLKSQDIDHPKLEEQLEKVGLLGKRNPNAGKWFEIREATYVFQEDQYGTRSVLLWEIHNPFEQDISKLTLGVLFYDSDETIIGGSAAFVNQSLRANSTTRASEYMPTELPTAASVKVSANWGYLLELEDD